MIARAPDGRDEYSLDLTVGRPGGGASRLTRRRVRFPWSLGRAFGGEGPGDALEIIPQSAGGGLLAGDVQRQRVRVEAGARALIRSAGATVVYGTPSGGVCAEQSWRFELGPEAALAMASEPFALRRRSDLRTRQTVVLPACGVFVGAEAVVIDQEATACWRSRLDVERPDGARVLVDGQRSTAEIGRRLASAPRPWRAFATLYALAPPERIPAMSLAIGGADRPGTARVVMAAAPLRGGLGLGVRIMASDGGAMRDAAHNLSRRLISIALGATATPAQW